MVLYLFNVAGVGFYLIPQNRILFGHSEASDGSQPIYLRVDGLQFDLQFTLAQFQQVLQPVTYPNIINCANGNPQ